MTLPEARPIIFTAESVRAILGGRKTQTRRIIQPQPRYSDAHQSWMWARGAGRCGAWMNRRWVETTDRTTGQTTVEESDVPVAEWLATHHKSPYHVGDRLWVKEVWRTPDRDRKVPAIVAYKADGVCGAWFGDGAGGRFFHQHGLISGYEDRALIDRRFGEKHYGDKWQSPLYMPRAASRLTLEIVRVRVERVQEISEEDAEAEGCNGDCGIGNIRAYKAGPHSYHFAQVWQQINGKRGFPWELNPWVWVLEFRRVEP